MLDLIKEKKCAFLKECEDDNCSFIDTIIFGRRLPIFWDISISSRRNISISSSTFSST